jgi:hypothetical protein
LQTPIVNPLLAADLQRGQDIETVATSTYNGVLLIEILVI